MAYHNLVSRHKRIIEIIKSRPCSLEAIVSQLIREDYDNTSLRTIQRDLLDIRSKYDIDIQYSKNRKVYEVGDRSQNNFDKIYEHVDRLTVTDSINKNIFAGKQGTINKSFVITDSPIFPDRNSGIEYFDLLLKACIGSKGLRVAYRPSFDSSRDKVLVVYPIALKQFRYRWYLTCFDSNDDHYKTLALDRILSVEIVKLHAPKNKLIQADELYSSLYGVSMLNSIDAEIVRIKSSKMQSDYIRTMPWDASQKLLEETDSYCIFEFFIKINYEFKQLILMQGAEVEVLEPVFLRKEITGTIKDMLDKYKKR